jgi:pentalenolactone synthase
VRTPAGDPAWLVTDYDEVRELLGDLRLGYSHPDPDNAARVTESALFGGRPPGGYETEHADRVRFRRLVQPYFSQKRMRAFRPRVQALASRLLDELAAREPLADLHEAVATPLPVLVICELLGVPFEDRRTFREFSEAAAATDDEARSAAGLAALWAYTLELVAQKRRNPAPDATDMISGLCEAEEGSLGDDYIAQIAAMILFAGHETTVVEIGVGAVLLFTNPGLRAAMAAGEEAAAAAVEECLRAGNTGGGGIPRYARTDLQVGGTVVKEGELLLLDVGAANHDPAVYPESEHPDPARDCAAHLTFGHGAHYCIGAPLARIELQTVLPELVRRFPTMRLAVPAEQLAWRHNQLAGGFAGIPVTW